VSTDAIVLLKADHKEVKALFRRFEKAGKGATKEKGHLVAKMIELLTVHTYLENEHVYPVLIESVEHHIEEEEQEWFPEVRARLGRKQLSEMGARMLEMKKTAPRSPAQPSALKKTVDAVLA
jgi:hemerythrin-like domain-containing protein